MYVLDVDDGANRGGGEVNLHLHPYGRARLVMVVLPMLHVY